MKLSLITGQKLSNKDLLVQFFKASKKGQKHTYQILSKAKNEMVNALFKTHQANFGPATGEKHLAYSDKGQPVLFVSLGTSELVAEDFRKLSAGIFATAKGLKTKTVDVDITAASEVALTGLAEGLIMSGYEFRFFKKDTLSYADKLTVKLAVEKTSSSLTKTLKNAVSMAEAVNFTRFLGDAPGNYMTPTQLSKEAQSLKKVSPKMKVTVWDKKRIIKEKMDSFLGVSLGSAQEPKFIIMEYKNGPAKQKPMCLVGKGLTFDCGGISIKPSAGMEEMKFDMCGGASVVGAMRAIADMGLKVNVIAFVPSTENMPGAAANKPGDIRKARNGVSIEINNTDAEGRLILADALCYASEKKPGVILDAATLTGAMVVALGNLHTGFYTRSNKLRDQILKAADQSEEKVWPMPLVDDHSKDMKGHYADVTNLAPSRGAGSATAAAFLEYFVDKDIPWAHFDVAGTAWHAGNRTAYAPKKGASGSMVRTFVEFAKNYK